MITLDNKWKALNGDERYVLCLGGRGSGKSFSVAFYTLMLTFELGHRILYTRKTMTSAHMSIIPQFKEVLEASGLEDAFDVTNTSITNIGTGSEILFKGLTTSSGENTAALKSLTGITTVVVDEAEELMDESLFQKVDLSVRVKGIKNKMILVMNPTTKEHWSYERLYLNKHRDDVCVIETTYLDNADNLSDSFLAQAKRMQQVAPMQYNHTFLGAWRDKAEGVIYSNWSTGRVEDESLPTYFGYDDGFSNDPAALVEVRVDKKQRKLFVKERLYLTGLIEAEKVNKLSQRIGKAICYADCASPSVIEAMRRRVGQNFRPASKPSGSIIAGIEVLRDYELIIDPESSNLIKELNNFTWNDKKAGVPNSGYDHLLDALRYVAFMELRVKPSYNKGARFNKRPTVTYN